MRSARSLNSDRPIIADKRAAILRAAIRVFAHNGYFNSKVADIASAAGVADGTVYLYFKSKEEILHSIFDRSMEEAIAAGKSNWNKSPTREKSCAALPYCISRDWATIAILRWYSRWNCEAPQNSWRNFPQPDSRNTSVSFVPLLKRASAPVCFARN